MLGADTGASGPAPGNLTDAKPEPTEQTTPRPGQRVPQRRLHTGRLPVDGYRAPAGPVPGTATPHRLLCTDGPGELAGEMKVKDKAQNTGPDTHAFVQKHKRNLTTYFYLYLQEQFWNLLSHSCPSLWDATRGGWRRGPCFPSLSASVPSMSHSGGICISCQQSPAQQTN